MLTSPLCQILPLRVAETWELGSTAVIKFSKVQKKSRGSPPQVLEEGLVFIFNSPDVAGADQKSVQ